MDDEQKGKARLVLENKGSCVATGLWLEDADGTKEKGYMYFECNYLYLLPGEKQCIMIEKSCTHEKGIRISSWNTETRTINGSKRQMTEWRTELCFLKMEQHL